MINNSSIIHDRENNEECENHLKQQADKFNGDCRIVFQLLYSGKRLTGRILEREYDIDSRRLRDVFTARPDIVKKTWVYDAEGKKTKFVEYYIEVPEPPTKKEVVEQWKKKLKDNKPGFKQLELL